MLIFIEDLGTKAGGKCTRRWCKARCTYCDKVVERRTQQIKKLKSCGCATHLKANIRHGLSHTRQYQSWKDMKTRCNNQKNKSYIRYGARRISYDKKWESFDGFWEDMRIGYFDGGTLERIDNNKGYYKDNCTWVTIQEQAKNRNPINTFKKRDDSTYFRKVTKEKIEPFAIRYKSKKHKEGVEILKEMTNSLGISVVTARKAILKYLREENNESKFNAL